MTARADLVVNQNLGTLAPGTTSYTGTTVGGPNNAAYYSNALPSLIWDAEYVYAFTVNTPSIISLSGLSNAPGNDNDAFLLNTLTTPDATGQAVGKFVTSSRTIGSVLAGTYYLSIDAYRETTGRPATGSAYSFDLKIADFATEAIDSQVGGTSSNPIALEQVLFYEFDYTGGALRLDTEGSSLGTSPTRRDNDTELALFDSAGMLIATDDDGGTGSLSLLQFADGVLTPGRYYLAASAYDTVFADGFTANTSTRGLFGTMVINGLSPAVPEPTMLATLAAAGLLLARRRRRA